MAHHLLTIAAITAPLSPADAAPEAGALGRIQLFPAGSFAARDGRPGSMKGSKVASWRCTEADARDLMALWQARATPIVIDYEHQTHLAEANGQPAPAAGWIVALHWEAAGLFADVDWTERARAHIAAKEYRYISPTFKFDPVTGAVAELVSAALTNHPALDGMNAVQAKNHGVPPMSATLLALLRTALGLPETADEAACEQALKQLPSQSLPTLSALLTARDAEIASLKAAATSPPNPAHFAPVALLTATQQQLAATQARVTELEGAAETASLVADIDAALADGRLHALGKEWAHNLARTQPEALRAFLNTVPPIAALTGQQSGGHPPQATASLTAEEEYVCAQLGIEQEAFLKSRKEHR